MKVKYVVIKKMSELTVNQTCKIVEVTANLRLKRRVFELGLIVGEKVKILAISPLKNSFLIMVKNYSLAIRKSILNDILVEML